VNVHKIYSETENGVPIECVMCDGTRNILELMKRVVDNKLPLCLAHLEDMAFLYTMEELKIYRKLTIQKYINSSKLLLFLQAIGFIGDDFNAKNY
jgi:hypothetical protein